MSFFKRRWSRKLQLVGEEEDSQVAFNTAENGEASCSIQVKVPGGSHSTVELEEVGEETSDGDLTDQEIGDGKSLIPSEEEIDSDGVVREYEVALKHLGFGLFHIFLLLINGIALLSDAIEILSISFVLPVLRDRDEYGAGDAEEGILSSIIFVGMLFGSYIWGGLADVIGRRTTLVCSLTLSAVFGFASAFSPWFWLFVLLRFCSGFGVGGSLPVIFPYTSEFIRNKYRGPYLGVQAVFWMFGRLLCGAFAWAIIPVESIDIPVGGFRFHSWRLFIAISALPSLIGAFMYFLLPESPRYLLEVGKQEKAMKGLRLAHKLNHIIKKEEYPVKSIALESKESGLFIRGKENKLKLALDRCKEVLCRTLELFKLEYWRRTPLLLVIMFCLSFGSYGVTLWYPTYVAGVTARKDLQEFEKYCNDTVNQTDILETYCGCSQTIFTDFDLKDFEFKNFLVNDVIFSNVSFNNVTFDLVVFNGTQFVDCQFFNSNITQSYLNATIFNNVLFDSVKIHSSSLCSMNGSTVEVQDFSTILEEVDINGNKVDYQIYNSSSFDQLVFNHNDSQYCAESEMLKDIQCRPESYRVYRDSFFISASAFPGNIASAFAVYFFRRNYWMAFVLFLSTISAFLLYIATSELFVVIMLCIFTAVSTPAWNDSSLLMAELYPTHLRSTAAGIHLLMARIGAIFGTNIFGAFINVNPSIPILLVAVVLFIGSMAALGLPKTTRKTLLK